MKKVLVFFVALLIFTAILHAEEINITTKPRAHEKPLTNLLPYPADQTELAFTKTNYSGVQHEVAKSTNNTELIKLIQAH